MAFVWRYADKVWSGPFLMLALQSVTFLAGTHGLLARVLSPTRAAIVAVTVLLLPPVLTPMAPVWKDAQMAGFLLAGTAALLSDKRGWRIAGYVLLFAATAVRHNALAATLPIVILLFECRRSGWRRYMLAACVWVSITLAAMLFNRLLTNDDQHPWHTSIALFDIAGVVRYSGETDDVVLRRLLEGTPLVARDNITARFRARYLPSAHHQLWHDDGRVFDEPTLAQTGSVARSWVRCITSYPGAFLEHRWALGVRVLGLAGTPSGTVFHDDVAPSRTPLQHGWLAAMRAIRKTIVFRPYLYLALAIAFLVMAGARLPAALLASGILCEVSVVLTAPSTDFRYSHWMIVTTVIAGVMIFVQRYRGSRPAEHRADDA
jgi:hypothetical protein